MIKRKPGPKSAAELEVKISAIEVKRPNPPEELSDKEKKTWEAVTSTKPADWWRPDTYPLLVAYCKHVAQAKRVDQLLIWLEEQLKNEGFDFAEWMTYLDKLLKARDRETRALVNLARSMRISQQAMILPRSAGTKTANTPFPHET